MNGQEILDRVRGRYEGCKSYIDSGWAYFDVPDEKQDRLNFRTRFVRPKFFSFEWQDYGPNRGKTEQYSTVVSNGHKTWLRWVKAGGTATEEMSSLTDALSGATGCSAGVAPVVADLLMKDIRGESKTVLAMKDLQSLPNETLEGRDCYVLKGSLFKNLDHLVWVSATDYSLRRLRSDRSLTAEECKTQHEAMLANTELMLQFKAAGISPPESMNYKDTRCVLDFFYSNVSFDLSLSEADFVIAPD